MPRTYAYECRECGWYIETFKRQPPCLNPATRCRPGTTRRVYTVPNLSSKATPTRKGQR